MIKVGNVLVPTVDVRFTLDFGADDYRIRDRVLSLADIGIELATEKARQFCMTFADGRWNVALEDMISVKNRIPYGGAVIHDHEKEGYLQAFVSLDNDLQVVYIRHVAATKEKYAEFSEMHQKFINALTAEGYTCATHIRSADNQLPFSLVLETETRWKKVREAMSCFTTMDDVIDSFKR